MEDFEIAVFENSDLYDGAPTVPSTEVVQEFMKQFKRYLSPYKHKLIEEIAATSLASQAVTGEDKV
jgi:hypothetical protein